MTERSAQEALLFQQTYGDHIFYCTEDLERYIDNAIAFIAEGIGRDEHVILVENGRISPMIQKKLAQQFTKEQLRKVHYYNNFDFYWKNKNFHPPTVLAHFEQLTGTYLEDSQSIRSWGHVEWGMQEDIEADLEEFESAIDEMMPNKKIIAVCAYDASRISDHFKQRLVECHGFLMTDHGFSAIHKS